jgi:predicted Ser/Thr protein kinase
VTGERRVATCGREPVAASSHARSAAIDGTACGASSTSRGAEVTDDSDDVDSVVRKIAYAEPVTPPIALLPGARVAHYEVGDLLGRGGMGVLYRAVDTRLGRTVALKLLRASRSDRARDRQFLREARSAAAASHPNVATVFDVGEASGLLYISMELVDGASLRATLAAGALDLDEGLRLAREIARGLAAAHVQGVVHRDLKPENVMIARDGRVKIVDFGLAKFAPTRDAGPEFETLEGKVIGTPGYMAPEQQAGKPTDARTDVYAFGIVMHELLTGAPPGLLSDGAAIAERWLAAIVRRCLSPEPQDRWANADEIAAALDAVNLRPRGGAPRRILAAAGALVCGAIAIFAVAAWWTSGFADEATLASATVAQDIAGCGGTRPVPGVCQIVVCSPGKYTWDIAPAARGLACITSPGIPGTCDGGQYGGTGDCVTPWEGMPQGLTGGIAYWDGSSLVFDVAVDGIPTLARSGGFVMHASTGWSLGSDGDLGKHAGQGFYHQELAATGTGAVNASDRLHDSRSFILPAGAACGFHHTRNTPPSGPLHTCMGIDPGVACPPGWLAKSHADAHGSAGDKFVWCEYTDPQILCENPACIAKTFGRGLAFALSSDTDAAGFTDFDFACPTGYHRGPFMDDGRGSGLGLSACLPGSTPR